MAKWIPAVVTIIPSLKISGSVWAVFNRANNRKKNRIGNELLWQQSTPHHLEKLVIEKLRLQESNWSGMADAKGWNVHCDIGIHSTCWHWRRKMRRLLYFFYRWRTPFQSSGQKTTWWFDHLSGYISICILNHTKRCFLWISPPPMGLVDWKVKKLPDDYYSKEKRWSIFFVNVWN
jgi:hypothetical protein